MSLTYFEYEIGKTRTLGGLRPARIKPFRRGCHGGLLVRQPPTRLAAGIYFNS
jgi:hypothetical protein